ncbi:hypothetical protein V9T40_011036 [Parthenolecanium corni]|uniref:ABC transporter domain-containing protein n=1 Tax=Parthenolecanium corni TaxID=536013 RepID=A0AAN9T767_9HEMI
MNGFAGLQLALDTAFIQLRDPDFDYSQKWFAKLRSNIEFNQLYNCDDTHQTKFFEKAPNTLEISIKIIDLFKRVGEVSPDQRNASSSTKFDIMSHGSLVYRLTKVFVKNRTPYVAVKDVYFSVRAGECFGLLGVNGAGKSTCFKMLTGDLLPTDGDSSIKNKWLRSNRSSCNRGTEHLWNCRARATLTVVSNKKDIPNSFRSGKSKKDTEEPEFQSEIHKTRFLDEGVTTIRVVMTTIIRLALPMLLLDPKAIGCTIGKSSDDDVATNISPPAFTLDDDPRLSSLSVVVVCRFEMFSPVLTTHKTNPVMMNFSKEDFKESMDDNKLCFTFEFSKQKFSELELNKAVYSPKYSVADVTLKILIKKRVAKKSKVVNEGEMEINSKSFGIGIPVLARQGHQCVVSL